MNQRQSTYTSQEGNMRRTLIAVLTGLILTACEGSRNPADLDSDQPVLNEAPRYRITDLGSLGGTRSFARNMNNRGEIVGESLNGANQFRAFLWTSDQGMIDLGTLGGTFSAASGINNDGVVVGATTTASGACAFSCAFRWSRKTGMENLGGLIQGGRALAINDRGEIVGDGWDANGDAHVLFWTASGQMRDLGTFGGVNASGTGLNNNSQIVGARDIGAMFSTAFIWSRSDGFTDLGNLGGTGPIDGAIAYDVNERGQVAGESVAVSDGDSHAFFWSVATGMLDLGSLGGEHAVGIRINNSGQIAGRSTTADGALHSFIWSREDGMRDLGTLGGGSLSIAHAINDRGQAAGRADTPDGVRHAVLWTPID